MQYERVVAHAGSQHGLVSYEQLRACGVADATIAGWLRQRRLERIAPAVYRIAGAPDTWLQRVMRATLDSGGWASHRTAAALEGLDGHNGSVIEVVVERWKRSSRRSGYTVHETKDLRGVDLTTCHGIPCTSVVRTLLDLPAVEHPFRAEQALDDAYRKDANVLPLLRERFVQVARRGRNGTTVMRGFLNERPGGYIAPGSTFEKLALDWIRKAGIEEPVKQFKVEDGEFVAYLDLSWPHLKFAMECDSLRHHFSNASFKWDRRRRRHLKTLGWEVTEWTFDEIKSGAFIPELRRLLLLASRTSSLRSE